MGKKWKHKRHNVSVSAINDEDEDTIINEDDVIVTPEIINSVLNDVIETDYKITNTHGGERTSKKQSKRISKKTSIRDNTLGYIPTVYLYDAKSQDFINKIRRDLMYADEGAAKAHLKTRNYYKYLVPLIKSKGVLWVVTDILNNYQTYKHLEAGVPYYVEKFKSNSPSSLWLLFQDMLKHKSKILMVLLIWLIDKGAWKIVIPYFPEWAMYVKVIRAFAIMIAHALGYIVGLDISAEAIVAQTLTFFFLDSLSNMESVSMKSIRQTFFDILKHNNIDVNVFVINSLDNVIEYVVTTGNFSKDWLVRKFTNIIAGLNIW